MVMEIPLRENFVALVDDEDYEYLSQFRWRLLIQNTRDHGCPRPVTKYYVYRSEPGRPFIYMHREILERMHGDMTNFHGDHRNGNGMNNVRSNLRRTDLSGNNSHRNYCKPGFQRRIIDGRRVRVRGWNVRVSYNGQCVYKEFFDMKGAAVSAYNGVMSCYYDNFIEAVEVGT